MKIPGALGVCGVLLAVVAGCGDAPRLDAAAHEQEVLEWRSERLGQLTAPMGYLTQTGLFWLAEGTYRFGGAAGNDVVFPGAAAPFIGEFIVGSSGIRMAIAGDADVRHDGEPVTDILLHDDTTDTPVLVTHGSLAWGAVKRDDRFAIRLRDFEHPVLRDFGPLPYYDIDPSLRVTARLRPYAEPRTVDVETVIEGLGYHPVSPGVVEFAIRGEPCELEAYDAGDYLFFVFGDATNRDDTYGAGRFLYAPLPGDDGLTVLDFNKAYSPPCAFNDFSTCPIATPRNRLPVRIEAGEKYEPSLHYSAPAGS